MISSFTFNCDNLFQSFVIDKSDSPSLTVFNTSPSINVDIEDSTIVNFLSIVCHLNDLVNVPISSSSRLFCKSSILITSAITLLNDLLTGLYIFFTDVNIFKDVISSLG